MFHLKLFGGVSLSGPDGELTGRAVQRHRLALLALLGGTPSRGLTRDKLVSYLWPDADAERARALLSDSIYRINQALKGEAIASVGDSVRLNPERVSCDVAEFRAAIARGDWEDAVERQAAPFLDGFYLPDAEEFERWSEAERQQLLQEKHRALEKLAETAGDPLTSARWWRRLAAESPYSSRIAVALMRALDASGERAAAIQHAQLHAQQMQADLGLAADPELLAYAERLRNEPPKRAQTAAPTVADAAPYPAQPVKQEVTPPRVRHRGRRAVVIAAVVIGVIGTALFLRRQADAGSADVVESIVVLPFSDQSPGRDQEYFGDGIAEELMARLADVPDLKVVGRTTAFSFKGKPVDTRAIADQLKVDAILSGSVRVSDKLRITAQLVNAKTGFEMWSETYERTPTDALDIQTDIANAIAARLRPARNTVATRAPVQPIINDAEAYNLYLRGRFEWHKRTEAGLRNAVTYLTQATQRAPRYARAHVGLGDAYAVLGFYDYLPPRTAFPNARRSALRALELDPSLAEAHNTLGYVALYYEWQWPQAEREFRRSIELDARYSTAHQWYGNFLTAMGRFDEAVREMRLAQDIDPLSLIANAALGWTWYYAGDYEKAVAQLDRTLELNPNFELAHLWRGQALQELRDYPQAIAEYERAVELSRGSAISTALLAQIHALNGDGNHARALLAPLVEQSGRYAPAYEIAKVYLALGDRDAAMQWLQRAKQERSHSIAFLRVDPQLSALRPDARFRQLLAEVGL